MSEFAKLSREERLDVLKTMPGHLAEIAEWESLHQLLTDFDFLEAKLNDVGIQALIKDYDLGINSDRFLSQGQTETLKLIQGAIRKSAQVLERDKTQLAGQLLGRLLDFDLPQIQGMLEQANQSKNSPWLRPLRANLERPGEGCLRTLTDRTGKVITVAIAPGNNTAISASRDNTLKIWDLASGRELQTLTGHTKPVWGVAIAPDGKTVISASDDNTLKIWDLASGSELRTLTGHTHSAWGMVIAPDGHTMIEDLWDHTLKIWDTETGNEVITLIGHTGWVLGVAIAPDGLTAISASANTLKVWDLASGTELRTLTGHTGWVSAVAIAPNGLIAVSGSSDRALKIWDLLSGKEIASFSPDAEFECCAIAPDGVTVVAGDRSGRVHFLRLEGVSGGG